MILEFLIVMLLVKYRHELLSVFSKDDEDEFVRRSLAPFAGLDYQQKRRLKLVVNND